VPQRQILPVTINMMGKGEKPAQGGTLRFQWRVGKPYAVQGEMEDFSFYSNVTNISHCLDR